MAYQSPETKLRNMLIEVLSKAELHDSFTLLSISQETMDWWINRKGIDRRLAERSERRKELRRLKAVAKDKLKDFLNELTPEEKKILEKSLNL